MVLDVSQSIEIQAPVGDAYAAIIRRLTHESTTPDNRPMPMILEEWPGGRWFRDLGNGQGHLWGFVQVIKPPNLIEIQGPMFMSYAVAGHLQIRVEQVPGGSEVALRHQAIGAIEEEHRAGVQSGWTHYLQSIKQMAEA
jgi:hypothetical protein